jgi:hypothetical protein
MSKFGKYGFKIAKLVEITLEKHIAPKSPRFFLLKKRENLLQKKNTSSIACFYQRATI